MGKGQLVQPEQQARLTIDQLLAAAGWHVCDAEQANIHAARDVAIHALNTIRSNTLDTTARVCICTFQRIYSMLKGRDLLPDLHTNGGGRVLSRGTNPMTTSIANHA